MNQQLLRAKMRQHMADEKYDLAIEDFHRYAEHSSIEQVDEETAALASEAITKRQLRPVPHVQVASPMRRKRNALPVVFVSTLVAGGALFAMRSSQSVHPLAQPHAAIVTETAPTEVASTAAASLDSCLSKSDSLYQSANYQESKVQALQALQLAKTANNRRGIATAYAFLGRNEHSLGRLQAARDAYVLSLDIYKQDGIELSTAFTQEILGGLDVQLGNLKEAEQELQQSLATRTKHADGPGIIECQRDLADLAEKQGELQKAEQYLVTARAGASREYKPDMEAAIDGQMGELQVKMGNRGEARRLLQSSLTYWRTNKHPHWIAATEMKLSRLEMAEGNRAESASLAADALSYFTRLGDAQGIAAATALSK